MGTLLGVTLAFMLACQVSCWQNSWDGAYTYSCPSGQVLYRVQSVHDNGREDRLWQNSCKHMGTHTGCVWTGWVNGWDADVNYRCPSGKMIAGQGSTHDNGREDRVFKYRCCGIVGLQIGTCYQTGYINNYDAQMDYSVSSSYIIQGFWSRHDNGREDRIWRAWYCKWSKVYCNNPGQPSGSTKSGTGYYYGDKVTYGCTTGYERKGGSTSRTCQSNKAWSGSAISCGRVYCNNPGQPSGSTKSGTGYYYGDKVTYGCATGYERKGGSTSRTCQSNKAWSGSAISCGRVYCNNPGQPSGSTKSGTGYYYGDKVAYGCATGYERKGGSTSRTCQHNKAWSGSAISCGRVYCNNPGQPTGSTKSGTGYYYGDKVTYGCASGYEKKGGDTSRTCQHNKAWGGSAISCGRVYCNNPGQPSYSTKSGNGYYYNDKVSYGCVTGYERKGGSTSRTCQSNKAWSGSAISCGKVSCGDPGARTGASKSGTKYLYGDKVTYGCITGWEKKGGDTTRTCQHNKAWSGSAIVCSKVSCGDPGAGTNAVKTGSTYTFGASLTYACKTGYQKTGGTTSITCGSNKKWSGATLQCAKVSCGDPGSVALATKTGSSYLYQDVVKVTCITGHEIKSGSASRSCQANKAWSGSKPVCGKVSCGDPGTPTQSIKAGSDHTYTGKVTYTCATGWERKSGSTSRTCQSNKAWTGTPIVCARVSCGDPGSDPNAAKTGSTYTYQAKVTYLCKTGYKMTGGSSSITCQANKKWSGARLTCAKVSCGDPGAVALSTKTGNSYLYQDVVKVTCITGHEIKSGSASRTCQANKQWTGSKPVCGKVSCGTPPTFANSARTGSVYTYQAKVTYSCNSGYNPDTATKTCGPDKKWAGKDLACTRVSCGDPGPLSHATKSGSAYLYQDKVTYTCVNGYELKSGNLVRTCGADKQWSVVPVCGKVGCKDPGTAAGAERNATTFVLGDTITYWCKDGWNVTSGASKVLCQPDKSWDNPILKCGRLSCGHPGNVNNASMAAQDFLYETRLNFTCIKGFEIKSGTASRVCQADQIWSGTQPTCGRVECPLTLPTGVQVQTGAKSKYVYEDKLTLGCKTGYQVIMLSQVKSVMVNTTVNTTTTVIGNDTVTTNVYGMVKQNITIQIPPNYNGTCTHTGAWNGADLTCSNIDDCSPNPCKNGGACTDGINDFTCQCTSSYSGKDCSTLITTTTSSPVNPLNLLAGLQGAGANVRPAEYIFLFMVATALLLIRT